MLKDKKRKEKKCDCGEFAKYNYHKLNCPRLNPAPDKEAEKIERYANLHPEIWDTKCPKCGNMYKGKRGLNLHDSVRHKVAEWEEKFNENFAFPNSQSGLRRLLRDEHGKLVGSLRADMEDIKNFFRPFLSEDHESDKRVEKIEKAIQDKINGITSFQTSPQSYQGLSEALDIIKSLSSKK